MENSWKFQDSSIAAGHTLDDKLQNFLLFSSVAASRGSSTQAIGRQGCGDATWRRRNAVPRTGLKKVSTDPQFISYRVIDIHSICRILIPSSQCYSSTIRPSTSAVRKKTDLNQRSIPFAPKKATRSQRGSPWRSMRGPMGCWRLSFLWWCAAWPWKMVSDCQTWGFFWTPRKWYGYIISISYISTSYIHNISSYNYNGIWWNSEIMYI